MPNVDVVVAPPAPYLSYVKEHVKPGIEVAAQNCYKVCASFIRWQSTALRKDISRFSWNYSWTSASYRMIATVGNFDPFKLVDMLNWSELDITMHRRSWRWCLIMFWQSGRERETGIEEVFIYRYLIFHCFYKKRQWEEGGGGIWWRAFVHVKNCWRQDYIPLLHCFSLRPFFIMLRLELVGRGWQEKREGGRNCIFAQIELVSFVFPSSDI